MNRNKQFEGVLGDNAAAKKLSSQPMSPADTYYPSHMAQTLNSLRRQSKHTYNKNSELYAQEEKMKALVRKIKQKRTQNALKARELEHAKSSLQFEQQKNANLLLNEQPSAAQDLRAKGLNPLKMASSEVKELQNQTSLA